MHNTRKILHNRLLIISLTLSTASLTPTFAAHNATTAIANATSLNDYQPHSTKTACPSAVPPKNHQALRATADFATLTETYVSGHKTRLLPLPIWHVVHCAARNENTSRTPQYSCCSRLVVQMRNRITQGGAEEMHIFKMASTRQGWGLMTLCVRRRTAQTMQFQ